MFSTLLEMMSHLFYLILNVTGAHNFPRPLSLDEERRFVLQWREQNDRNARNKLIEHNLRLVAHIIKKYYSTQSDQDDLVSIGTIGLIKSVDTFDHTKGARLSSYAARCIENEILMFFRNNRKNAQNVSIHDPIDTDKEGNALTLMDLIAVEDTISDDLSLKIESEKLHRTVRQVLDPRERQIIVLRYGLVTSVPLPQRLVAKKLGISRSYVSRIEKKALAKLRAAMESK
jgi:RNA polymerase sporulation-specific sigma factor